MNFKNKAIWQRSICRRELLFVDDETANKYHDFRQASKTKMLPTTALASFVCRITYLLAVWLNLRHFGKTNWKKIEKNCHLTRRGKGRVSVPYNTWYAWENFFLSLLWVLSLFLPNWQVRVFLRRILNQWTNKSWVHSTQHTPFGDRWFTAMARATWWGLVNDLLMTVNWAAQRTPTNRLTNPKSPN